MEKQIETRINELEMKCVKERIQTQVNHYSVLNALFGKGVLTPQEYDKFYIEMKNKMSNRIQEDLKKGGR